MILDAVVIAVVLLMCVIGVKRGILKSALRVASWLLSTVLAWIFYSPVAEFLKTTAFSDTVREAVRTNFVEPRISGAESSVPELFGDLFESGIANGADAATAAISEVIIAAAAFVLTLILCRLLIFLLGSIIGIASKLPVIKQFNKLLSGVLGAAEGVLILYIAATIVFVSAPLHESEFFEEQISDSTIASQIYENNFITNLFNKTE